MGLMQHTDNSVSLRIHGLKRTEQANFHSGVANGQSTLKF